MLKSCPIGRAMTNIVGHSKSRNTTVGGNPDKGIFGKKKSKAPKTILRKRSELPIQEESLDKVA